MVVGQTNDDERGNLAGGEFDLEVTLEFFCAELVRNAQVEGWIAAISGLEDRFRQWRVEEEALPSTSRPSP
jgi:hypothetical protein